MKPDFWIKVVDENVIRIQMDVSVRALYDALHRENFDGLIHNMIITNLVRHVEQEMMIDYFSKEKLDKVIKEVLKETVEKACTRNGRGSVGRFLRRLRRERNEDENEVDRWYEC